jgi:polyvinyl alcohol dehydrogenase (cytochrome)
MAQDGGALFTQNCAICHDSGAARIPTRAELRAMPQDRIIKALESGLMQAQGAQRTPEERKAIAAFLSPGPRGPRNHGDPSAATAGLMPVAPEAMCRAQDAKLDLSAPQWNGWGSSLENHRSQSRRNAGLSGADVSRLKVKWTFGFPGLTSADANPVIVGKWVFVGSSVGRIYALDLDSGCIHWTFDAERGVRSALNIARIGKSDEYAAVFADRAFVYRLDASSGKLIWKQRMGEPPMNSGATPAVFENRVYVPMGAGEEGAGGDPKNECCKSRGAIAALDLETGKLIWQTSTIREPLMPTRRNSIGTQLYGPSGASAWTPPTIDAQRRRLYIATGNSYSDPAASTSDAILALDMDTGEMLWSHQATANDAYNSGCDIADKTGCPIANGPDFDFAQPPILVSIGGDQRLLVIGQKSGLVYGFDPDDGGREVWRHRVGTGGVLGGINWGSAVDESNVYVAVSDHLDIWERDDKLNPKAGGLVAIRLADGKQMWRTNISGCSDQGPKCSAAQSAPVAVIPGAVFSGSLDGHVRAYDPQSGRVLWDFDTVRDYKTVNGVPAKGGSIDSAGIVVAGGVVLTNSGYSKWQSMPGNVLIAFTVDGTE